MNVYILFNIPVLPALWDQFNIFSRLLNCEKKRFFVQNTKRIDFFIMHQNHTDGITL